MKGGTKDFLVEELICNWSRAILVSLAMLRVRLRLPHTLQITQNNDEVNTKDTNLEKN